MNTNLSNLIDLESCPITSKNFIAKSRADFVNTRCLLLPKFLTESTRVKMVNEANSHSNLAYYTDQKHNVYLTPANTALPPDHAFNRQVTSSKGCITMDQIPANSGLHEIYQNKEFKDFVAEVVGESEIYPYVDTLSGINVHFADEGRELGWHFDNSSFATTLLLQAPEAGGSFQYVKGLRDAGKGEMNFMGVEDILDGKRAVNTLDIAEGTLVLFSGRNSIHRVTATIGKRTRILVVLAYNNKPDVALSESAQMTFYGRLG